MSEILKKFFSSKRKNVTTIGLKIIGVTSDHTHYK